MCVCLCMCTDIMLFCCMCMCHGVVCYNNVWVGRLLGGEEGGEVESGNSNL